MTILYDNIKIIPVFSIAVSFVCITVTVILKWTLKLLNMLITQPEVLKMHVGIEFGQNTVTAATGLNFCSHFHYSKTNKVW